MIWSTTNSAFCRIFIQYKRTVVIRDSPLFLFILILLLGKYTKYIEITNNLNNEFRLWKKKRSVVLCTIQQELMRHLQNRRNQKELTENRRILSEQDLQDFPPHFI